MAREVIAESFTARILSYQSKADGQLCTIYSALNKLRRELSNVQPCLENAAKAALAKLDELERKHGRLLSPHIEVAARMYPWTAHPLHFMTHEALNAADAEILGRMSLIDHIDGAAVAPDQLGFADPEACFRLRGPTQQKHVGDRTTPCFWSVADEFANWKDAPLQVPNWGSIVQNDFSRYLDGALQRWPRLARVMRTVFAAPASFAWLESSFSIATWVADPRRWRLSQEHMADLTCNREPAELHIPRVAAAPCPSAMGVALLRDRSWCQSEGNPGRGYPCDMGVPIATPLLSIVGCSMRVA